MGYDIAVFDKRRRFHSVEELNENFHTLDDGDETKDYTDYRNSTPELQNWFHAMKDIVRPLKGEFAPPESEMGHRAYHEIMCSDESQYGWISPIQIWIDCMIP